MTPGSTWPQAVSQARPADGNHTASEAAKKVGGTGVNEPRVPQGPVITGPKETRNIK